ncbi:30S ribosome-binding factor RbfA [candidate division WOR-3 bacterium]|nr:30S ribosome-binding factor RbfA [candidate division WOR-3 bacterium]
MVNELRKKRMESEMMKHIAIIINRMNDSHLRFITITDVVLSGDTRIATVYFTYGENRSIKVKAVENASGYIRTELAKRVKFKFMPKLVFKKDPGYSKGKDIEELFRQLRDEENN